MTPAQISMVKASWRMLMKIDPEVVGGLFYDKLFYDVPEVKRLFKASKEVQAKKLIDMINLVVMRLDKLEEFSEDIRQMAIRHVGYGAKLNHYAAVGSALVWTLKKALGKDWNPALEESWTLCYSLLANAMIHAASESESII